MQQQIYMLVGCPGVGKSWVCKQLAHRFHYVPHDVPKQKYYEYVQNIGRQAQVAKRPLLIESPFSVNEIKKPLERMGHSVTALFILEPKEVVSDRYMKREGRPILPGHLTRQETYRARALEMGAFFGTSEETLRRLTSIADAARV